LTKLPNKKETVIIHYGCSDFKKSDHVVFWIGAIFFDNGEKEYFFPEGEETEKIQKLADFVNEHKDQTFIHWSMNHPSFGFSAIERRYKECKKSPISTTPAKKIDLSEYLKETHGVDYVPRERRLNQLAKLNGFLGVNPGKEVITPADATARLELIYSIYEAERQGKLMTLNSRKIANPFPGLFTSYGVYKKFLEYTGKHIIDPYIDHSYLKKRLEAEGLTHKMKDLEFIEFIYRDMKLPQSQYEDFIAKGKLSALKKSFSVQRENNFNNIFK